MALSNTALTVTAFLSLGLSILALYLLVRVATRDGVRPELRTIPPDKQVAALVDTQARAIQRLEGAVRKLAQGERQLGELAKEAIRHVGVIRFDAFEDMGGRLSFSAALLDGNGDGVVITSINGRQDTRCYAKRVQGGTSIHNLSDEERQAIRDALETSRQIVEAS
jgi:Protein of unknown function (DUF4446)